jgi:hypothetical protein
MKKIFLIGAASMVVTLLASTVPAAAQAPGGRGTPPGWEQGNREGWRGGSLPPGQQRRDDAWNTNQRGVYRGEVVRQADRNANLIDVRFDGRDVRTVVLDRNARVTTMNGRTGRLHDIRRGEFVTVRTRDDITRTQGRVTAQAVEVVDRYGYSSGGYGNDGYNDPYYANRGSISGEVITEAGRYPSLRIRESNGRDVNVEAAPHVAVRREGRPSSLHQIRRGEWVTVTIDQNIYQRDGRLVATRIDSQESRNGGYYGGDNRAPSPIPDILRIPGELGRWLPRL